MKCLKCGFVASESKETCSRCGSPLPVRPASARANTPRSNTPEPASVASRSEQTPDWRSEVTRKVREYGEKKKILTTPPNPLKENSPAEAPVEQAAEPSPSTIARNKIITAALARVEPPEPIELPLPMDPAEPEIEPFEEPPPDFDDAVIEEDLAEPFVPEKAAPPQVNEIFAGDLDVATPDEEFEQEPLDAGEAEVPLHLERRIGASIVDHTILVLLHAGLLYLCAEIMNLRYGPLIADAWMPIAGVFLLFHCLYFVYFYKTSRQTPGMVFFGIELRDPLSGFIPVRRILVRWFAFVFLNAFNFVPLFMGRKYLVLDAVSGTQVRTLK